MTLPALPDESFALQAGEPLAVGLKRLSVNQFDRAIAGLRAGGSHLDKGIHESRKVTKRLRAVLRMVRPVIGDKVYRVENAQLRDAARLLAGVRDGLVTAEAVTGLRKRFAPLLTEGALLETESRLKLRHQRLRDGIVEDGDLREQVVVALHRARSRFAAWPVDTADPQYGARLVANHVEAIAPGIGNTYRAGRRWMGRAYMSYRAEAFHAWRKEAKYLRHQMEIVAPVWPEVVGGLAHSLADLGEVLGEEHDLAQLIRLITGVDGLCPDPLERTLLAALAQARRRDLQAAAAILGGRIYAETTDRFVQRLSSYWQVWAQPRLSAGLD
jgi:CHAD domain-containing protein